MIKHLKKLLRAQKVLKKAIAENHRSQVTIDEIRAKLNGDDKWVVCVRKCMDTCEQKNRFDPGGNNSLNIMGRI